jgi:hypothetical protein
VSAADLALLLGDLLTAPSPSDGGELNSVTVSPGLPGFFATFVLAAVVVLLLVDMSRRTRRVQARARVQERMEAEEQARRDGAAADGADALEGGTPEDADGKADDERPAPEAEGPTPDDRR